MGHRSKLHLPQLATRAKFLLNALQNVTKNPFWLKKITGFFIKVVTIAASDRGIFDCFVEAGISAGYAKNSASIDGTDIIRSIPAIGRELRFPLDIILTMLPKLTDNRANSVVEYLRLTDKDRIFIRIF